MDLDTGKTCKDVGAVVIKKKVCQLADISYCVVVLFNFLDTFMNLTMLRYNV